MPASPARERVVEDPSASATPGRCRRAALALALVALVCAAFAPAFQASFVNWDDDHNFLENHDYRGLSGQHLAWMATTHHMGHYQPLAWLTLGIDYDLWGMDARGYHATNVLLHALAALTLFVLARELLALGASGSRAPPAPLLDSAALLAALLFAVHPLRCESVAWVTERRDVLAGWLLLATLLAYVRYARSTGGARGRWYGLALVLFPLSLAAKATGLVLPGVLVVLDLWPLQRQRRESVRALLLEKLPFALVMLLSAAVALWAVRAESALQPLAAHGTGQRLLQATYGLSFYVRKSLWPVDLVPIYRIPAGFEHFPLRYVAWAAAAVAVTLLLFVFRRRLRPAWSAWACYAILLLPTSGLSQAGPQLVAERYSYLACVPFALLAAGGWLAWFEHRPAQRELALFLAGLVVVALAGATWRQTQVWHDSEALWTHTLSVDPDNSDACQNLGVLCMRRGAEAPDPRTGARLLGQALELFEHGASVAPDAQFLVDQGLTEMLLSHLDPAHQTERLARARTLVESGLDELARSPGGVPPAAQLQHAILLLELGATADAERALEEYVGLRPDDAEGRRLLATALVSLGRTQEALTHLLRAVELEPEDATLWARLGLTEKLLGQLDAARAHLERARELGRRSTSGARSDPILAEAERGLADLAPGR